MPYMFTVITVCETISLLAGNVIKGL